MAQPPPKPMTVEEFFECQERQDKNYELVDGIPVLPRVTVWRRREALTHHEEKGLDATIDLPEVGTSLPLRDLYLDLEFPA